MPTTWQHWMLGMGNLAMEVSNQGTGNRADALEVEWKQQQQQRGRAVQRAPHRYYGNYETPL